MNRRQFLSTTLGSAVVLSAGCTESRLPNSDLKSTVTTTVQLTPPPTETETSTPTPAPRPPSVKIINLLTGYENYGDVVDNAIENYRAEVGSDIYIGYRFESWVHEGVSDTTIQVSISNERTQNRIDIDLNNDRQFVEESGPTLWENAMTFNTEGWETNATYIAEVLVRDNILEKVSPSRERAFWLDDSTETD